MPQIDAVTYFPIILWSLLLIVLGYILFTTYGLLLLTSLSKIRMQWTNHQIGKYWTLWNQEEVADWAAWSKKLAAVLQVEANQK
jgi:hypothetical protein